MSAVDNELYKASPVSLSTQDFILESEDRGYGVTPLGVALTRIDLQQYDCSQLDRWTVVHQGFASIEMLNSTLPPSWVSPLRYGECHSASCAGQRSISTRNLRKKDCWIYLRQVQNCIIPFILLSFSPNLHPTFAPSARNPLLTTLRFLLIYSAYRSSHSQEKIGSFSMWRRYLWTLQVG